MSLLAAALLTLAACHAEQAPSRPFDGARALA